MNCNQEIAENVLTFRLLQRPIMQVTIVLWLHIKYRLAANHGVVNSIHLAHLHLRHGHAIDTIIDIYFTILL